MSERNNALVKIYEIFKCENWACPEKAARNTIAELDSLFVEFLTPLLPSASIFDPFLYCTDVVYALSAVVTVEGCIPCSPKVHNLIFKFEVNGINYSYKYSFRETK